MIQLVLKSPSSSRWLPFKFVQMVMMHELAHCKQMDHSSAFWKVKNEFSDEMKALWRRGYTGDGLWGRGILLENGAFAREELDEGEELPQRICGGTFKSRGGRKRMLKPKITHKERQERRIKKKFGTNGMTLGADEETKAMLETGKKTAGKPRVAGSARGRYLRAAAALARLNAKKESEREQELVTDIEAESDVEDATIKTEIDDTADIDWERILDSNGRSMVRVCGDEDKDDKMAQLELSELHDIDGHARLSRTLKQQGGSSPLNGSKLLNPAQSWKPSRGNKASENVRMVEEASKPPSENDGNNYMITISCPVCSIVNEATVLTCIVCSNVLQPECVP